MAAERLPVEEPQWVAPGLGRDGLGLPRQDASTAPAGARRPRRLPTAGNRPPRFRRGR